MATSGKNRYVRIIEWIFEKNYRRGNKLVLFKREEIVQAARECDIKLPKNLGDVIYSFKYRTSLPESIKKKAPPGKTWVIVSYCPGLGRGVLSNTEGWD